MNSAMGPIFNIFFLNKVTMGPMNSVVTIVNSKFCLPKTREWKKRKEKKKEENSEMKTQMPNPNPHSVKSF